LADFGDLFQRATESPELARLLQLDSSRAGTWTALILLSGLAIIFCRASSRSSWSKTSMNPT
jgi:hypothetical protein